MKTELRRVLLLRDLIFYGIVCIQPTAPMPLFGVASQEARGHVVTTVLLAMIGNGASPPSATDAWRASIPARARRTPTSRGEFGPTAGFVAGWSDPARLHPEPVDLRDLVQRGGRESSARRSRRGPGRFSSRCCSRCSTCEVIKPPRASTPGWRSR